MALSISPTQSNVQAALLAFLSEVLPGVPGQGLLTILLGLVMMDIPGKRPLEARKH